MTNQDATFTKNVTENKTPHLAESVEHVEGIKFLPFQKMLFRVLAGDAKTIAYCMPRQNGKSYAARAYAVYAARYKNRSVLYSCHNSSTTSKMFEEIDNICHAKGIAPSVKRVRRMRGTELIVFNGGGRIEFSTRTNSGLRGGSYDVIIFDEAQELTEEQVEAILPTISAAGDNVKQIYIGTPPNPQCAGTVLRRMHDNAHSNVGRGSWLEWSEKTDPTSDNVLELAERVNPAYGLRIEGDTIKDEFAIMSKEGFKRERLGFWEVIKSGTERAIDIDAWKECGTSAPLPKGRRAYGVKITFSDIALCGVVEDGDKVRVSLIERKNAGDGVQWVADFLNARNAPNTCVVIDGRNGVDLLIDKLKWKRKGSVIKASMAVMTDASARLVERVANRTVTWNKLNEVLDLSARGAIKRKIGQGWGFGGDDPSPIEGCALALYGFEKSEKKGEQRIG